MADTITKTQRSKNMALIRSRGNKSTEMALLSLLRKNKISGWRRHSGSIAGRPDFIFQKQKIAIFVDGCFWHGCPKCNLVPKSNKIYWSGKIIRNKKRDRNVSAELRKAGWIIIRIWEHTLKNSKSSQNAVDKIAKIMAQNKD
jgi:DNA mismatch endonuclease (patch repair protein)